MCSHFIGQAFSEKVKIVPGTFASHQQRRRRRRRRHWATFIVLCQSDNTRSGSLGPLTRKRDPPSPQLSASCGLQTTKFAQLQCSVCISLSLCLALRRPWVFSVPASFCLAIWLCLPLNADVLEHLGYSANHLYACNTCGARQIAHNLQYWTRARITHEYSRRYTWNDDVHLTSQVRRLTHLSFCTRAGTATNQYTQRAFAVLHEWVCVLQYSSRVLVQVCKNTAAAAAAACVKLALLLARNVCQCVQSSTLLGYMTRACCDEKRPRWRRRDADGAQRFWRERTFDTAYKLNRSIHNNVQHGGMAARPGTAALVAPSRCWWRVGFFYERKCDGVHGKRYICAPHNRPYVLEEELYCGQHRRKYMVYTRYVPFPMLMSDLIFWIL